MSELAGAGDWVGLQNKVFTHYISQKVAKRQIKVADCVKEMTDGMLLIQLLEVLSEKTFTGKIEKNPKLEVQKLDNISQALKFCWECGVEMKIKPAPDSLFKEDQKVILGLVWAIMLRFMKFGEDDEDQTNAKDALRMWVANKTAGYAGVQIQDMSNSFRDGLALCALVHKHREKSIDFASLSAADGAANIRTAQEAAKKYFLLEPYLTPEEVQKLDDNSMVVYIGDYYVAFAEMRKLETAAKRISKVIKLTKENDAARAEYKATGEKWVALRDASLALLNDRTIDNTMAGAKARLAAFHKYKKDDKTRLIGWQMDLHQVFNTLQARLKHNNRPAFQPAAGQSPTEVDASITAINKLEAERQVELYAELNRQIKLVKLDSVHKQRHEAIVAWCGLKKAYLEKKEVVDSVSAAQLQIRLLDAYVTENKAIFDGSVATLTAQSAELEREKYEKHSEVAARDKAVADFFAQLEALEKKKRPVLEDDLAREEFKERMLALLKSHEDSHAKILKWVVEKEKYVATKETIDSVPEARSQLIVLEKYEREQDAMHSGSVVPLKELGDKILASLEYKTEYSQWTCPKPQDISDRFAALIAAGQKKRPVLEDHLAREEFKAKMLAMLQSHEDLHAIVLKFVVEKEAYVAIKEVIDSVPEARAQLVIFEKYAREQDVMYNGSAIPLKELGDKILASLEYKTEYSQWTCPKPQDISDRFAALIAAGQKKRPVLEDHLAREEFKEKTNLLAKSHEESNNNIMEWIAEKEAYLAVKEVSTTVAEARAQLTTLDKYEREKESMHSGSVVPLKELGAQILAQEYKTEYSQWKYPTPADITNREKTIDDKWASLSASSAAKKAVLEADLAREVEKERLRLEFAHMAAQLERWSKETIDNAQMSTFGFNLQEVEAYRATMDAENKALAASSASQSAAYTEVFNKAAALGVTENVYTTHNLETLAALRANVDAAIAARTEAYEKELAHQRHIDALCKAFADVAVPFVKWLADTQEKTNVGGDDLDAQVGFVNARLEALDAESKVGASKERYDEMEKEGIQYNPHTTLAHPDVDLAFSQYKLFLEKKKVALDEAIQHKRLRGLSQQDFDDIDKNFIIFDKDKSGNISKKELKACLYSLGVETTKAEIEAYLTKYGNGTAVPKAGFTELMLTIVGVTDTKENILLAFQVLNKEDIDSPTITVKRMKVVMEDDDIAYVTSTAKQAGEAYEYAPWTEDVFSR
eukprot:TRINITY_DN213_c0_g1_i1.p1 TRINITY_DN213_c0_g1~~TRINITY_DN213_c0_g1_i1.p1  ORF type:complete len:1246 (-),score=385.52 TRINITY_DN213_c0_g1_i1:64-3723(-)